MFNKEIYDNLFLCQKIISEINGFHPDDFREDIRQHLFRAMAEMFACEKIFSDIVGENEVFK